jgi:hypothetical protein
MNQTITHKNCSVCEKVKPISCFGVRKNRGKTGFREDCKDCRHKIENPKTKKTLRQAKIDMVNFLGRKCIRCDYSYPEGIDFHHIDPSKKLFTIGDHVIRHPLKSQKYIDELKKCAPLCKNCHAEYHAERFDLEPYLHKIPKFNENTEKQNPIGDELILGLQISFVD